MSVFFLLFFCLCLFGRADGLFGLEHHEREILQEESDRRMRRLEDCTANLKQEQEDHEKIVNKLATCNSLLKLADYDNDRLNDEADELRTKYLPMFNLLTSVWFVLAIVIIYNCWMMLLAIGYGPLAAIVSAVLISYLIVF
eukprot:NODE_9897_length_620_cov_99.394366_g9629_i0.p1 GENE.NODE_9897_length_620_cov_99.394366_g9629_i0~~NODE_9897_length_620_cov_99.394366_g9629_i0.p1  ORF type:complete len:158 (-),score=35.00 NODE_9897_length_620_cov_99.394366_g9629_i0:147-569(-)